MNSQYQQAHDAIKNEANEQTAVALHTVIISLGAEKLAVSDRLADLTGNELFSSHGRALVNREQELYIAQKVLCELAVKEYRGRGRQQQCVSATTAAAMPVAVAVPDGGTPGPWRVRKREKDGEVLGCFVTAPDCQGRAYDADILGDDYDTMERKLADCELIVAAVNTYRDAIAAVPTAATPVRDMAVGIDRARYYAQACAQQIAYDEVVESIRERDEAEEFGDKLLDLVLGNDRPEWSSAYGTDDALLQVEEKMAAISKQDNAMAAAGEMLQALQIVAKKLGSRPYGTGSYLPKAIREMVTAAIAKATAREG